MHAYSLIAFFTKPVAVSKCQWRRMSAKPSTNDSFLSGSAGIYTEQMYDLWRKDPKSVHASWATYFQNLESGLDSPASFQAPPSSFPRGMPQQPSYLQQPQSLAGQNAVSTPMVSDSLGVSYLIRAYQSRGHEIANLDPLGLNSFRDPAGPPPELDYRSHGFKEEDLDRQLNFLSQATGGNKGFLDIMV